MNVLLTTPALNVFEHMALDEIWVHTYPAASTLRIYHWADSPAVTFGYAQFIREVRPQTQANGFTGPLCRRPTGGGVVYHTEDLTFSVIFPSQASPKTIYKQLHEAVQAALVLGGLPVQLFTQPLPAAAYAPSQQHRANTCFVNPVENDLLTPAGQKMLGGAIRRFGNTVLYQGSLQVSGARQNPAYKQAVIQAVRSFLGVHFRFQNVPPEILAQTHALARTQYQTPAWTEKF